jgi:hypothetical protein
LEEKWKHLHDNGEFPSLQAIMFPLTFETALCEGSSAACLIIVHQPLLAKNCEQGG